MKENKTKRPLDGGAYVQTFTKEYGNPDYSQKEDHAMTHTAYPQQLVVVM
jgi:hypothetical protein